MAANTDHPRTVRVPTSLWNQALDKATAERKTVSEIIRHALGLYVNDRLPDGR